MSKTTNFRPGRLLVKFIDVLLSLVLKETASRFSLSTHVLFPASPNVVIAAGKQPKGGNVVTPIFLAPKPYKFCQQKKKNRPAVQSKPEKLKVGSIGVVRYWLIYLHKGGIGSQETIRVLIRRENQVKDRIDVIALKKIA